MSHSPGDAARPHGRRIVFVNRFYHPDTSATAQILTDVATHLAAQGHAVTVVTGRARYDDPAARLPSREQHGGVAVRRVRSTRFGRGTLAGRAVDYLTFYPAALFALLSLLRRGDVVVAKTDPPLISVVVALAAGLRRARLVNWLQDLYPEVAQAFGLRLAAGPLGGVLRRVRDWSLRRARLNVAIGELMAERLVREGTAQDRVCVIQNWSDDGAVRPIPSGSTPLRAEWGFAPGDVVIGYSGNLGRAHEYGTLLAAARRLAHRGDLRFLFVGGGGLVDRLRAEVRAAGLTSFVFVPYQPRARLSESLGAADVHWLSLLPALEGLIVPSKLFGIAAAGRPVLAVADPAGEVGRLLDRSGAGVTVSPGDDAALADAIAALADDPARRARMGVAARTLLESGYDKAAALRRWEGVIARASGD